MHFMVFYGFAKEVTPRSHAKIVIVCYSKRLHLEESMTSLISSTVVIWIVMAVKQTLKSLINITESKRSFLKYHMAGITVDHQVSIAKFLCCLPVSLREKLYPHPLCSSGIKTKERLFGCKIKIFLVIKWGCHCAYKNENSDNGN